MSNNHSKLNQRSHCNARFLIERGDCGYRPGERFPVVGGHSDDAQILRAVIGRSESEYEKSLEYEDARRRSSAAYVFGYDKKVVAGPKRWKAAREYLRRHRTLKTTFNDSFALPRHIKGREFVQLYNAVAFANSKNAILNIHLTISWKLLGYGDDEAANLPLSKLFIKNYTQWCSDNDIDCIWIYSNEFSGAVGLHTHFMTSVSEEMQDAFRGFVENRLQEINRLASLNEAACDISIPKSRQLARQWIRFQYLCKGVDQNARLKHANGIDSMFVSDLIRFGYENPGSVGCRRRCGVSRNLDKAARRKAGFESTLEKGYLNVNLLYPDDDKAKEEADAYAQCAHLNI